MFGRKANESDNLWLVPLGCLPQEAPVIISKQAQTFSVSYLFRRTDLPFLFGFLFTASASGSDR